MKSRRPYGETLERRQLLAGDVCLADAPIERIDHANPPIFAPPLLSRPDGPSRIDWSIAIPYPWTRPPFFVELGGSDLLEERGGLVAAIRPQQFAGLPNDNQPAESLYLLERQGDGTLAETNVVDLNFNAHQLLLTDHWVIVVGVDPGDAVTGIGGAQTRLVAISRTDATQRTDLSLDGLLANVAEKDGRLFVSTFQPPAIAPLIYQPGALLHQVSVFDVNDVAFRRIAQGDLPTSVTENMVVGDDIVMVETYLADQPSTDASPTTIVPVRGLANRLVRFRINDGGFSKIASLELESQLHLQTKISDDGQSAVTIGSQDVAFTAVVGAPRVGFNIGLIDLSQDQPALFDSLTIGTQSFSPSIEIGQRAVVIADGQQAVIVVNTDQSIDVDAANRIKKIELSNEPSAVWLGPTHVRELTPNTYLIARTSYNTVGDANALTSSSKTELLTLSISESSVVSRSLIDGSAVAVFSATNSAPVIVGFSPANGNQSTQSLVIGSIDAEGQFTVQTTIEMVGALEIDSDQDRLLIRYVDHLVEFRWNDLDTPVVTPLGPPLPPPQAVDDVFRRNSNSRDRYLNVLANDQTIDHDAVSAARIVELVDAPPGVTIASGGDVLMLTDAALGTEGTYQFDYVIAQGNYRATASVTLTLFRYTNADVQQAVERIVSLAADELGIDASEIRVGSERAFLNVTMPTRLGTGDDNPLGGQFGVVVDLVVDQRFYRYAANFEGQAVQLSSQTLETVMELQLRATDAQGNPIESIQSGDEFYLEVTAQDLREFGSGVFGVAFDLPLPTNKLELTGELVLLGYFDDFGDPITPGGIDEFSAIEALIPHPGNDAQPVVRFGVRAIAGGAVRLQLDPADTIGRELLVRGFDYVVSPLEVRFGSLELQIDGVEPTDTDASGSVTPTDALRVINFLGLYGNVRVDELATLAAGGEGEDAAVRLRSMRRLDTNADGQISARDALHVINDLSRLFRPARTEPESVDTAIEDDFLSDEIVKF